MKTSSKRDIECASASQKAKYKNTSKRRAILSESTSAGEGEEPVRKQKKKETARTPELAFNLENEQRPNIIEMSSGTTESESQQIGTSNNKQGIEQKATEEPFPKIDQNSGNEENIEKSSKATPLRVLEQKRCPTKRYGIDVMQLEKEKITEEV